VVWRIAGLNSSPLTRYDTACLKAVFQKHVHPGNWFENNYVYGFVHKNVLLGSMGTCFIYRLVTFHKSDGPQCVYQHQGESYLYACVKENERFGWSVCDCLDISHGVVTLGSYTAGKYRNQVLRSLIFSLNDARSNTLMLDNARPHVAMVCTSKQT
jgi:hypothetical protein